MENLKRVAKENTGVRSPSRTGFQLTDRDIEILKLIHDYRLLRIQEVEMLTGRTYTRVHRRLKGLFDEGYLKRIELPQKKDIYHIARPGLAILLTYGLISDDEAERRSREHELKPITLDHELMITEIHVALDLASRAGPIKLLTWMEGEAIRDAFEGEGTEPRKQTILPDAFFELRDTRTPDDENIRSFFLEADRSTMPIQPRSGSQRFRDKIERYRSFIERRPFEKYGVRSIRILTLTLTPKRRDNLCADTEKFLAVNNRAKFKKYFLFGSWKDFSTSRFEGILEPLFRRPGDPKPYSLFPVLAQTAERV